MSDNRRPSEGLRKEDVIGLVQLMRTERDAALARAERAEAMLEEARRQILLHVDHHEMLGKLAQHTVINEVGKNGRNIRRGIRYVVQFESKCAAEKGRAFLTKLETKL